MSEEVENQQVDNDDSVDPISTPEAAAWWNFDSKDTAAEWANGVVEKRLARERKKYEKELQEYATLKSEVEELRPLKTAQQTDSERWESEKSSLLAERDELRNFKTLAERNDLVREIAESKGLPSRFLSRVKGEDSDAITADIEDLMTVLNDGKSKPPARKPQETDERPSSKGYGGGGSKTETDNKAVIDNIRKKAREQGHQTFTR